MQAYQSLHNPASLPISAACDISLPHTAPLAPMTFDLKSQLLDICQLQSNVNIFAAKYPGANIVCGVQLEGCSEFRWQTYGPYASQHGMRMALELIEEEVTCHASAGGSPFASKHGAKFRTLKSFIDAAAGAGVIAGVQVTLLMDLAKKISQPGESGLSGLFRGASQEMQALSYKMEPTSQPPPSSLPSASLPTGIPDMSTRQSPHSKGTASEQMLEAFGLQKEHEARASLNENDEMLANASEVLCCGKGGKKGRFTPEQVKDILHSVKTHCTTHPGRYTELVIKDIKEKYPELQLDSAAIRKLKFRLNIRTGKSSQDTATVAQREVTPEAADAAAPAEVTRCCEAQESSAMEAIRGLVGMIQARSYSLPPSLAPQASVSPTRRERLESLSMAAENVNGDCPPPCELSAQRPRTKRKRLSQPQMVELVKCVKSHVQHCPERYTQMVMRDMLEKFPGLELNMGQIRKVKFRCIGNARQESSVSNSENELSQDQNGDFDAVLDHMEVRQEVKIEGDTGNN